MNRYSLIWMVSFLSIVGVLGCEQASGDAVVADVVNDITSEVGAAEDVADGVPTTDGVAVGDTHQVDDVKCGSGNKTFPEYAAQCIGVVGCQYLGGKMCACVCSQCNGPVCVEVLCGDGPSCWGSDVTQDQTDTADTADTADTEDTVDTLDPPNPYACIQKDDCVAVETQCCDHCNGGEAVAVNAKHAEAYEKPDPACSGVACTEMACAQVQVDCVAGACAIVPTAPACAATPVGQFCVRGTPGTDGEVLAVGAPIQVTVRPKGCFSSSCTEPIVATCQVTPSSTGAAVTAEFCLKDTSNGNGCTADCGGGGFASCTSGAWTAGTHPIVLGALQVDVTVPSTLPFGGACVGGQF